MPRPRRHLERLSRLVAALDPFDDRPHRPVEHLEALDLVGMEMLRRKAASRPVGRLHLEQFAAGLGPGPHETQPVPVRPVQLLPRMRHGRQVKRYGPGVAVVPPARHLLRAKDLADARYLETFEVDDLASAAGLSRAHFSRKFRRAFGESRHAYLLTRRLERAAALLRSTDPLGLP